MIPTAPASAPLSSSVTDTNDNGQDGDDNGSQPGAPGTVTVSPLINLSNGLEPLNAAETYQGGAQDGTAANPDNQGDMTVDFGFKPALSIGSTVFYDVDDSGTQDASNPLENGIAGVTVQLWQDTNNDNIGDYLVGTDMTDANGDYYFNMLSPGAYQVVIPNAPGDAPVSSTGQDTDSQTDSNDNGAPGAGAFAGQDTVSTIINLSSNNEPAGETGQGGTQDDAY